MADETPPPTDDDIPPLLQVDPEDDNDVLWQRCPVIPYGQRNGIYYFISAAGEWRELGLRDLNGNGLLSLFNGDRRWLAYKFAAFDKQGKPNGDFAIKTAVAGLMRKCAMAGLWNLDTPIRGVGVWRGDHAHESPIAHCGDALVYCDENDLKPTRAGRQFGGAIYPASPSIALPKGKLRPDMLRAVIDAFGLWNYATPGAAILLLGAAALDALGAAPEWRVHTLLTGARGDGKSTLARFFRKLLGAQAAPMNDFTEAGLRQTFTRTALTYVLDEAEGDSQFDRIAAVVQFLRRMTGEEGLQSVRGTAGGISQQFSASSPALLSAINPPSMLPQDRSRFLTVELRPADPKKRADVLKALQIADIVSPAFRARALLGWQRFRDNLGVYHESLIEAGCDPRQADKFGALLAAADMMRFDDPATPEGVAGMVEQIADLIAETIAEDEEASDSKQCLATLMTRQIEHWKGGSKSTIGRLAYRAINDNDNDAGKDLRVYGLRVEMEKFTDGSGVKWWLFVANQHEGLTTIFRDTRWRGGAWKTSLLRLPGAERSKAPIRFDGVKERAVQIPEAHLPLAKRKNGPAPPAGEIGSDDDPFAERTYE